MVEELINKPETETTTTKQQQLINKLINKSLIIKSFCVQKSDLLILHEFEQLSLREDGSRGFSDTIVKAMKEYLRKHNPPNPQPTLDRSFNLGMPVKPNWQCCVEKCSRKAVYLLSLKNFDGKIEQFQVCEGHKQWKHSHFRFVMGIRKVS